MAGMTKAQALGVDRGGLAPGRRRAQGRRLAGATSLFRRADRSQRFERELGGALWFALAIVLWWIGAN